MPDTKMDRETFCELSEIPPYPWEVSGTCRAWSAKYSDWVNKTRLFVNVLPWGEGTCDIDLEPSLIQGIPFNIKDILLIRGDKYFTDYVTENGKYDRSTFIDAIKTIEFVFSPEGEQAANELLEQLYIERANRFNISDDYIPIQFS